MLDISVTAYKAKARDLYAPLELSNEGPPRDAGKALLSDHQATFLGDFVLKYLPARQRDDFRQTVLSKLADGRPGGAAFRRAIALAALDHGFTREKLEAAGIALITERNDRKIASSRDCDIT
jgi:hypothetical protein